MHTRLLALLGCLVGTVVCSACESDDVTCAGTGVLGIRLHVVDAVSRTVLDRQSTVTIRRLRAPFDSTIGSPPDVDRFTADIPSVWSVTVVVPGYQTQHREVTVPASRVRCQEVDTQDVTFEMARVASAAR